MSEGTIRLFGPPAITVDGEDKLQVMPVKGFALLAYLCLEGGSQRRERIATLLWADAPQSRSRASLRTLLYDLNKIAPGLLDVERQTVAVAAGHRYAIDLLEARRLIRSDDKEERLDAASHLHGPFLQGLHLDDAPAFETWLSAARERWRVRGVDLLQQAAGDLLLAGRLQEARGMLQRLLRFQPWHEETHYTLMRLFAAEGDYASALHQYKTLAGVLARELDVLPDARSVDLHNRIRQRRRRPRARLPQQPAPFVGRERVTARLQSLLASREHRLLSILGAGGIGKTRLALRLAQRSGHLFLDGVFFVSLAGVGPADPFYAPLALALGLQPINDGDVKRALLEHLRGRELLLILDNVEHLVDQAAQLAEIMQEAPSVQLLVTSRQPLGVSWETRYRIEGLPVPAEGDARPLAYASTKLFATASQRADPAFDARAHGESIARICRQLGGSPLGIELAAALVGKTSPREIADDLEHNLELLAVSFKDRPPRQRSMRAVFDASWELLDAQERQHLSRLAIFRGGFTREAAYQVARCPGTILRRLVEKSLLSEDDGRYDFHQLVRRFALERLAETDAAEMAEKHAAYFASQMSALAAQMVGHSQAAMIDGVGREFANYRAAWDFSLQRRTLHRGGPHQGQTDDMSPLLEGLARYFDLTSLFREAEAFMAEAGALLKNADGAAASHFLAAVRVARARFINKQGRFEEALAIVREIAGNEAYPQETRAAACLEMGWALWHTGRYADAEAPLAQGQPLAMRAEAPLLLANILRNRGIVAWYQSDFEAARRHTQQAYEHHKEIGDLQGMADALNNLALVAGDQGDYLASMDYLQQAIEIKEALGDLNGSAIALGNLGILHTFLGQYDQAEKALGAAIGLSQKVGNLENLGHSTTNRCGLYVLQGRFDEAKVEAQRALQLVRRSGDRFLEGYVLEFWGLAHEGAGELSEAESLFRDSLALRRETDLDEIVYHALGKLTYNAARQGKHDAAAGFIDEMETLRNGGKVKNVRVLQTGMFNCYRALKAAGDPRASGFLQQAVDHLESQAQAIVDAELRRSFLENVAEHRLIVAARGEYGDT